MGGLFVQGGQRRADDAGIGAKGRLQNGQGPLVAVPKPRQDSTFQRVKVKAGGGPKAAA